MQVRGGANPKRQEAHEMSGCKPHVLYSDWLTSKSGEGKAGLRNPA